MEALIVRVHNAITILTVTTVLVGLNYCCMLMSTGKILAITVKFEVTCWIARTKWEQLGN